MEKFLRYDPPVQYIGRVPAESFTYRGRDIEKGRPAPPSAGSANRDPKQFADPDVPDVRGRPRRLSMSEDVHRCSGAALVRVQAAVALRTPLTRVPDVRVRAEPPPVWNSRVGFHGLKSLTVPV